MNGPQIKYIRLGYNHTVLVGGFSSHIGPFWVIFGPFQSDLSCQSKIVFVLFSDPVWVCVGSSY